MPPMISVDHLDMIDQAYCDRLNARAIAVMRANPGRSASGAIDQVILEEAMGMVDETDPKDTNGGYVQLYRLPNDRYATVWIVSPIGSAMDVTDADDYENNAIGFDTQALGWDNRL
jgi:hypothetical protein